MSTQPSAGTDESPDRATLPTAADPFVRGLSEAIGGPLGGHAVRRGATGGRFWTTARIVLALCCLTLALHWVQKTPCQDGNWVKNVQYNRFCYTDVVALYESQGLGQGQEPYRDRATEF